MARLFYSGDIGVFDHRGLLHIVDRKKDLVKLAHGEYIALGKLESVYRSCGFVESIMVFGDSKHTSPVALVVPNRKPLIESALKLGISNTDDFGALCTQQKLVETVLNALLEEGKRGKLKGPELVSNVALLPEPWTPQTGLVTEAFKLKRNVLVSTFKKQLEALYGRETKSM